MEICLINFWTGIYSAAYPEGDGAGHLAIAVMELVQSLNSPFFPPPIGAETGRAERRVQDNLHVHAQNAAIFPPNSGKKNIFGSTFQNWLVARFSE